MAYTAIDDPEAYFQVKTYTGNGSTQSITLDGDTDMQPDIVWFKIRSDADYHALYDAVRGATKRIHPDLTSAEGTVTDGLTSFNSDGFSMGDDNGINKDTETYVAWNWKESATSGVDIVAYTGTGSAKTEAHSLSAAPKMVIVKTKATTGEWITWHTGIDIQAKLSLNTTDGIYNPGTGLYWNSTAPTSSVFSVGTSGSLNGDSVTYIAYLFADVQGFSKFGSYTGNGNADGAFIYTGFRPAMIIFKQTNAGGEKWYLFDNKRNPFNLADELLFPSANLAESVNTTGAPIDILSNGFKIRGTDAAGNASGSTYIYMAFAEAPFVNSEGVPCNAR